MALALYSYNRIRGTWEHERNVHPDTAEQWLAIFRKSKPDDEYVISNRRPVTEAEKQLKKMERERKKRWREGR